MINILCFMFQMKYIYIIITVKMNSNGRSEKFYKRPAVQHIGIVELVAEDPSAPAPALEAESGERRETCGWRPRPSPVSRLQSDREHENSRSRAGHR